MVKKPIDHLKYLSREIVMKKFISFIVIIISLIGYGLYNKEKLNIWFGMNDHQQAAHQFWFTHKNTLDETGTSTLPFAKSVTGFEYIVQSPVEQDGKYYFETTLYINGQYPLPIYTVVKAVDGVWVVDENATFHSAGDASLNFYINRYLLTLDNADKFLVGSTTEMNKQEIAAQIKLIERMFNDKYIL